MGILLSAIANTEGGLERFAALLVGSIGHFINNLVQIEELLELIHDPHIRRAVEVHVHRQLLIRRYHRRSDQNEEEVTCVCPACLTHRYFNARTVAETMDIMSDFLIRISDSLLYFNQALSLVETLQGFSVMFQFDLPLCYKDDPDAARTTVNGVREFLLEPLRQLAMEEPQKGEDDSHGSNPITEGVEIEYDDTTLALADDLDSKQLEEEMAGPYVDLSSVVGFQYQGPEQSDDDYQRDSIEKSPLKSLLASRPSEMLLRRKLEEVHYEKTIPLQKEKGEEDMPPGDIENESDNEECDTSEYTEEQFSYQDTTVYTEDPSEIAKYYPPQPASMPLGRSASPLRFPLQTPREESQPMLPLQTPRNASPERFVAVQQSAARTSQMEQSSLRTSTMQPLPPRSVPMQQLPRGSVPMQQLPRMSLPMQQLPRMSLPMQQLPRGSVPMQQLPRGSVPMQQVPRMSLPMQPLSPKGSPLQQLPRGNVPMQQVPRMSLPMQPLSPKGSPLQQLPRGNVPMQQVPRMSLPMQPLSPKGSPLQQLPRGNVPMQQVPRMSLPMQTLSPKGSPLQQPLSAKGSPMQQLSQRSSPMQQQSQLYGQNQFADHRPSEGITPQMLATAVAMAKPPLPRTATIEKEEEEDTLSEEDDSQTQFLTVRPWRKAPILQQRPPFGLSGLGPAQQGLGGQLFLPRRAQPSQYIARREAPQMPQYQRMSPESYQAYDQAQRSQQVTQPEEPGEEGYYGLKRLPSPLIVPPWNLDHKFDSDDDSIEEEPTSPSPARPTSTLEHEESERELTSVELDTFDFKPEPLRKPSCMLHPIKLGPTHGEKIVRIFEKAQSAASSSRPADEQADIEKGNLEEEEEAEESEEAEIEVVSDNQVASGVSTEKERDAISPPQSLQLENAKQHTVEVQVNRNVSFIDLLLRKQQQQEEAIEILTQAVKQTASKKSIQSTESEDTTTVLIPVSQTESKDKTKEDPDDDSLSKYPIKDNSARGPFVCASVTNIIEVVNSNPSLRDELSRQPELLDDIVHQPDLIKKLTNEPEEAEAVAIQEAPQPLPPDVHLATTPKTANLKMENVEIVAISDASLAQSRGQVRDLSKVRKRLALTEEPEGGQAFITPFAQIARILQPIIECTQEIDAEVSQLFRELAVRIAELKVNLRGTPEEGSFTAMEVLLYDYMNRLRENPVDRAIIQQITTALLIVKTNTQYRVSPIDVTEEDSISNASLASYQTAYDHTPRESICVCEAASNTTYKTAFTTITEERFIEISSTSICAIHMRREGRERSKDKHRNISRASSYEGLPTELRSKGKKWKDTASTSSYETAVSTIREPRSSRKNKNPTRTQADEGSLQISETSSCELPMIFKLMPVEDNVQRLEIGDVREGIFVFRYDHTMQKGFFEQFIPATMYSQTTITIAQTTFSSMATLISRQITPPPEIETQPQRNTGTVKKPAAYRTKTRFETAAHKIDTKEQTTERGGFVESGFEGVEFEPEDESLQLNTETRSDTQKIRDSQGTVKFDLDEDPTEQISQPITHQNASEMDIAEDIKFDLQRISKRTGIPADIVLEAIVKVKRKTESSPAKPQEDTGTTSAQPSQQDKSPKAKPAREREGAKARQRYQEDVPPKTKPDKKLEDTKMQQHQQKISPKGKPPKKQEDTDMQQHQQKIPTTTKPVKKQEDSGSTETHQYQTVPPTIKPEKKSRSPKPTQQTHASSDTSKDIKRKSDKKGPPKSKSPRNEKEKPKKQSTKPPGQIAVEEISSRAVVLGDKVTSPVPESSNTGSTSRQTHLKKFEDLLQRIKSSTSQKDSQEVQRGQREMRGRALVPEDISPTPALQALRKQFPGLSTQEIYQKLSEMEERQKQKESQPATKSKGVRKEQKARHKSEGRHMTASRDDVGRAEIPGIGSPASIIYRSLTKQLSEEALKELYHTIGRSIRKQSPVQSGQEQRLDDVTELSESTDLPRQSSIAQSFYTARSSQQSRDAPLTTQTSQVYPTSQRSHVPSDRPQVLPAPMEYVIVDTPQGPEHHLVQTPAQSHKPGRIRKKRIERRRTSEGLISTSTSPRYTDSESKKATELDPSTKSISKRPHSAKVRYSDRTSAQVDAEALSQDDVTLQGVFSIPHDERSKQYCEEPELVVPPVGVPQYQRERRPITSAKKCRSADPSRRDAHQQSDVRKGVNVAAGTDSHTYFEATAAGKVRVTAETQYSRRSSASAAQDQEKIPQVPEEIPQVPEGIPQDLEGQQQNISLNLSPYELTPLETHKKSSFRKRSSPYSKKRPSRGSPFRRRFCGPAIYSNDEDDEYIPPETKEEEEEEDEENIGKHRSTCKDAQFEQREDYSDDSDDEQQHYQITGGVAAPSEYIATQQSQGNQQGKPKELPADCKQQPMYFHSLESECISDSTASLETSFPDGSNLPNIERMFLELQKETPVIFQGKAKHTNMNFSNECIEQLREEERKATMEYKAKIRCISMAWAKQCGFSLTEEEFEKEFNARRNKQINLLSAKPVEYAEKTKEEMERIKLEKYKENIRGITMAWAQQCGISLTEEEFDKKFHARVGHGVDKTYTEPVKTNINNEVGNIVTSNRQAVSQMGQPMFFNHQQLNQMGNETQKPIGQYIMLPSQQPNGQKLAPAGNGSSNIHQAEIHLPLLPTEAEICNNFSNVPMQYDGQRFTPGDNLYKTLPYMHQPQVQPQAEYQDIRAAPEQSSNYFSNNPVQYDSQTLAPPHMKKSAIRHVSLSRAEHQDMRTVPEKSNRSLNVPVQYDRQTFAPVDNVNDALPYMHQPAISPRAEYQDMRDAPERSNNISNDKQTNAPSESVYRALSLLHKNIKRLLPSSCAVPQDMGAEPVLADHFSNVSSVHRVTSTQNLYNASPNMHQSAIRHLPLPRPEHLNLKAAPEKSFELSQQCDNSSQYTNQIKKKDTEGLISLKESSASEDSEVSHPPLLWQRKKTKRVEIIQTEESKEEMQPSTDLLWPPKPIRKHAETVTSNADRTQPSRVSQGTPSLPKDIMSQKALSDIKKHLTEVNNYRRAQLNVQTTQNCAQDNIRMEKSKEEMQPSTDLLWPPKPIRKYSETVTSNADQAQPSRVPQGTPSLPKNIMTQKGLYEIPKQLTEVNNYSRAQFNVQTTQNCAQDYIRMEKFEEEIQPSTDLLWPPKPIRKYTGTVTSNADRTQPKKVSQETPSLPKDIMTKKALYEIPKQLTEVKNYRRAQFNVQPAQNCAQDYIRMEKSEEEMQPSTDLLWPPKPIRKHTETVTSNADQTQPSRVSQGTPSLPKDIMTQKALSDIKKRLTEVNNYRRAQFNVQTTQNCAQDNIPMEKSEEEMQPSTDLLWPPKPIRKYSETVTSNADRAQPSRVSQGTPSLPKNIMTQKGLYEIPKQLTEVNNYSRAQFNVQTTQNCAQDYIRMEKSEEEMQPSTDLLWPPKPIRKYTGTVTSNADRTQPSRVSQGTPSLPKDIMTQKALSEIPKQLTEVNNYSRAQFNVQTTQNCAQDYIRMEKSEEEIQPSTDLLWPPKPIRKYTGTVTSNADRTQPKKVSQETPSLPKDIMTKKALSEIPKQLTEVKNYRRAQFNVQPAQNCAQDYIRMEKSEEEMQPSTDLLWPPKPIRKYTETVTSNADRAQPSRVSQGTPSLPKDIMTQKALSEIPKQLTEVNNYSRAQFNVQTTQNCAQDYIRMEKSEEEMQPSTDLLWPPKPIRKYTGTVTSNADRAQPSRVSQGTPSLGKNIMTQKALSEIPKQLTEVNNYSRAQFNVQTTKNCAQDYIRMEKSEEEMLPSTDLLWPPKPIRKYTETVTSNADRAQPSRVSQGTPSLPKDIMSQKALSEIPKQLTEVNNYSRAQFNVQTTQNCAQDYIRMEKSEEEMQPSTDLLWPPKPVRKYTETVTSNADRAQPRRVSQGTPSLPKDMTQKTLSDIPKVLIEVNNYRRAQFNVQPTQNCAQDYIRMEKSEEEMQPSTDLLWPPKPIRKYTETITSNADRTQPKRVLQGSPNIPKDTITQKTLSDIPKQLTEVNNYRKAQFNAQTTQNCTQDYNPSGHRKIVQDIVKEIPFGGQAKELSSVMDLVKRITAGIESGTLEHPGFQKPGLKGGAPMYGRSTETNPTAQTSQGDCGGLQASSLKEHEKKMKAKEGLREEIQSQIAGETWPEKSEHPLSTIDEEEESLSVATRSVKKQDVSEKKFNDKDEQEKKGAGSSSEETDSETVAVESAKANERLRQLSIQLQSPKALRQAGLIPEAEKEPPTFERMKKLTYRMRSRYAKESRRQSKMSLDIRAESSQAETFEDWDELASSKKRFIDKSKVALPTISSLTSGSTIGRMDDSEEEFADSDTDVDRSEAMVKAQDIGRWIEESCIIQSEIKLYTTKFKSGSDTQILSQRQYLPQESMRRRSSADRTPIEHEDIETPYQYYQESSVKSIQFSVASKEFSVQSKPSSVATKDFSVQSKPSSVATKDISVQSKPSSVATKDFSVQSKPSSVATKDFSVQSKPSSVATKDFSVQSKPSSVATKDFSVQSKPSSVATKDFSVQSNPSSATTKDFGVQSKQPCVVSKQTSIASTQTGTVSKKTSITSTQTGTVPKKTTITLKQTRITSQQPSISSKQIIIASKQSIIASKQPVIASKQPVIASKQPVIASKQILVASKQPTIASKQPTIAPKQPSISSKQLTLAPKQPTIASKPFSIVSKQSSVVSKQVGQSTIAPKKSGVAFKSLVKQEATKEAQTKHPLKRDNQQRIPESTCLGHQAQKRNPYAGKVNQRVPVPKHAKVPIDIKKEKKASLHHEEYKIPAQKKAYPAKSTPAGTAYSEFSVTQSEYEEQITEYGEQAIQSEYEEQITQSEYEEQVEQSEYDEQVPQSEYEEQVAQSEYEEEQVAQSEYEEQVAQSEYEEEQVAQSECEEEQVAQSEYEEGQVAQSEYEEEQVAQSEYEEEQVPQSEYEEQPTARSECGEQQTARSEYEEQITARTEYEEQVAQSEYEEQETNTVRDSAFSIIERDEEEHTAQEEQYEEDQCCMDDQSYQHSEVAQSSQVEANYEDDELYQAEQTCDAPSNEEQEMPFEDYEPDESEGYDASVSQISTEYEERKLQGAIPKQKQKLHPVPSKRSTSTVSKQSTTATYQRPRPQSAQVTSNVSMRRTSGETSLRSASQGEVRKELGSSRRVFKKPVREVRKSQKDVEPQDDTTKQAVVNTSRKPQTEVKKSLPIVKISQVDGKKIKEDIRRPREDMKSVEAKKTPQSKADIIKPPAKTKTVKSTTQVKKMTPAVIKSNATKDIQSTGAVRKRPAQPQTRAQSSTDSQSTVKRLPPTQTGRRISTCPKTVHRVSPSWNYSPAQSTVCEEDLAAQRKMCAESVMSCGRTVEDQRSTVCEEDLLGIKTKKAAIPQEFYEEPVEQTFLLPPCDQCGYVRQEFVQPNIYTYPDSPASATSQLSAYSSATGSQIADWQTAELQYQQPSQQVQSRQHPSQWFPPIQGQQGSLPISTQYCWAQPQQQLPPSMLQQQTPKHPSTLQVPQRLQKIQQPHLSQLPKPSPVAKRVEKIQQPKSQPLPVQREPKVRTEQKQLEWRQPVPAKLASKQVPAQKPKAWPQSLAMQRRFPQMYSSEPQTSPAQVQQPPAQQWSTSTFAEEQETEQIKLEEQPDVSTWAVMKQLALQQANQQVLRPELTPESYDEESTEQFPQLQVQDEQWDPKEYVQQEVKKIIQQQAPLLAAAALQAQKEVTPHQEVQHLKLTNPRHGAQLPQQLKSLTQRQQAMKQLLQKKLTRFQQVPEELLRPRALEDQRPPELLNIGDEASTQVDKYPPIERVIVWPSEPRQIITPEGQRFTLMPTQSRVLLYQGPRTGIKTKEQLAIDEYYKQLIEKRLPVELARASQMILREFPYISPQALYNVTFSRDFNDTSDLLDFIMTVFPEGTDFSGIIITGINFAELEYPEPKRFEIEQGPCALQLREVAKEPKPDEKHEKYVKSLRPQQGPLPFFPGRNPDNEHVLLWQKKKDPKSDD